MVSLIFNSNLGTERALNIQTVKTNQLSLVIVGILQNIFLKNIFENISFYRQEMIAAAMSGRQFVRYYNFRTVLIFK